MKNYNDPEVKETEETAQTNNSADNPADNTTAEPAAAEGAE